MFVKDDNGRLMITQIYVNDIVFGGMSNKMVQHFVQQMQFEFEMSLVGNNLISWFCKKQNCVSLSTTEAEHIAAGSSCSQLVWMKQMLMEYNVEQDVLTLYCDNLSAINISKNPIQHSRTKHIDIRHHFITDLVEEKVMTLEYVDTEEQLADIFTEALDAKQFEKLRGKLGIFLHEEV